MVNVRCFQVQVTTDGATWNTISHHFVKSEAEHEAQANLFVYRRINKAARTRVMAHAESLTTQEYMDLVESGLHPEKI